MARRILGKLVWVVLATLALGSAGCLAVVAGAAAAGGAATYAYVKGRSTQDYPSGFAACWKASHDALPELGLKAVHEENNGTSGTITTRTADDRTVTIELTTDPSPIPAESNVVTHVSVRVGTFGDQPVSDRVISRIGARLVPTTFGPPGHPPAPRQPIQPVSWNRPAETAPPPEVSPERGR
jgi:hypothetical protein